MPTATAEKQDKSHHFDWNLLKTFLTIVETGGVSRAAERLQRKQSSVSLSLQRLEQRVGVQLCRRGPGGFALTEEGQRLAENCVDLGQFVKQLPGSILGPSPTPKGTIKISLISNLVHPVLDLTIATFHSKYPDVEILVQVDTWSSILNSLLRQEIDIGVAPSVERRAQFYHLPLFNERHRPYCGRGHRLYGKRITNPKKLSNEAFILTGADEPDQLSDFRMDHRLGTRIAAISVHLEEAKRLAVLGVGICFLPEGFAAPEVATGHLWPFLGKNKIPSMMIYVISNNNSTIISKQLFIKEFMLLTKSHNT
ncbi:MAG: LysR family transcriptional regulator [Chitinophagales bacterium]|nr:LysR family transcriptional regulator [Hyphomicrobiales bacterium]